MSRDFRFFLAKALVKGSLYSMVRIQGQTEGSEVFLLTKEPIQVIVGSGSSRTLSRFFSPRGRLKRDFMATRP